MADTFLLTWNPDRSHWNVQELKEGAKRTKRGRVWKSRWSCGNTKKIKAGDRVFLVKLGKEPRGIVASGWVVEPTKHKPVRQGSAVYEDAHWKEDKAEDEKALYVDVAFDHVVDPDSGVLPVDYLRSGVYEGMTWTPQNSGVTIPEKVARRLEKDWAQWVAESRKGQPIKSARKEQGGGFGAWEDNRQIEEGAIHVVARYFQRRGWKVADVSGEKRGYDLLCRRRGEERHVEVKGISGRRVQFPITANERRAWEEDPRFVLAVVTEVLRSPKLRLFRGRGSLGKFAFEDLAYMARLRGRR